MARIRTVKPEAFCSPTLARVSLGAERTFLGLLTQADDLGRIAASPAALNGFLWAERQEYAEHSVADLRAELAELVNVGLLCSYEDGGRTYMHLPSFLEHQRVSKPSASKVPACPSHPQAEAKSTSPAKSANAPAADGSVDVVGSAPDLAA